MQKEARVAQRLVGEGVCEGKERALLSLAVPLLVDIAAAAAAATLIKRVSLEIRVAERRARVRVIPLTTARPVREGRPAWPPAAGCRCIREAPADNKGGK